MRIKYELFKLCKSKPLLIIFVLSISVYCLICALAKPDLSEYPFDTRLYKMYIEKYEGEFSQSTLDKMNSELQQLNEQAQESLENKALSAEEYIREDNKRTIAQQKSNALEAVKQWYEQLKGGARLVYDLELNAYYTGWLRKIGIFLCLAVITIITIKLSLDDCKCAMEQILFTTSCGKKKMLIAKVVVVTLLALLTALVFSCIDLSFIIGRWDLGDISASVQSFRSFEGSRLGVSMFTGMYISGVLRIIGFMVYSLLLMFFARITKNDIAATIITVVIASGCIYAVGMI